VVWRAQTSVAEAATRGFIRGEVANFCEEMHRSLQNVLAIAVSHAAVVEAAWPMSLGAFQRSTQANVRAMRAVEDMLLVRVLRHEQRAEWEGAMAAALGQANFSVTDRFARGADGLWALTGSAVSSPERPLYLVVEAGADGMNNSLVGADLGAASDQNATTRLARLGFLAQFGLGTHGEPGFPPQAVIGGGFSMSAAIQLSPVSVTCSSTCNLTHPAWPQPGQGRQPGGAIPLTRDGTATITHMVVSVLGPRLLSEFATSSRARELAVPAERGGGGANGVHPRRSHRCVRARACVQGLWATPLSTV
jgi:hypothetical protein